MNRLAVAAPLAVSIAMFVMGCGGSPTPASTVDGPPVDALIGADGGWIVPAPTATMHMAIVPPPPVDDAGAPVGDDAAVDDDATPDTGPLATGDAAIDAAPTMMAHDAAPEAATVDAQAPSTAALCCIGTSGNALNVHCGVGATASCDTSDAGAYTRYSTTTFNSAQCNQPKVGTSCVAWPESSGSPKACETDESCCMGTVEVCP